MDRRREVVPIRINEAQSPDVEDETVGKLHALVRPAFILEESFIWAARR
jgi:hypothetical protein